MSCARLRFRAFKDELRLIAVCGEVVAKADEWDGMRAMAVFSLARRWGCAACPASHRKSYQGISGLGDDAGALATLNPTNLEKTLECKRGS